MQFPEILKSAEVVPILKSSDPTAMDNGQLETNLSYSSYIQNPLTNIFKKIDH